MAGEMWQVAAQQQQDARIALREGRVGCSVCPTPRQPKSAHGIGWSGPSNR
jgi:hypothetical protein